MKTDLERWLTTDGQTFLKKIGVKKDQFVLDFGCGVGHYTIPLAKLVGKKGRVYALDKDKEALTTLMETSKAESLMNIEPLLTQGELKIALEDESLDVVLLYDVLHYMAQRRTLLSEIHRVLRPDALLLVYPKHHKFDEPFWTLADIKLEDVIREIEEADFHLEMKTFERLMHDDNYDKGYILNFKKVDLLRKFEKHGFLHLKRKESS